MLESVPPIVPTTTCATLLLPTPTRRSAVNPYWITELTTPASRKPIRRTPNVGHHRPRTSRHDRPRAFVPLTPSVSRAGTATAHATPTQIPGRRQAAKSGRSARPAIRRSQRSDPNRRNANASDDRHSGVSPRYASATALKHAPVERIDPTSERTTTTRIPVTNRYGWLKCTVCSPVIGSV